MDMNIDFNMVNMITAMTKKTEMEITLGAADFSPSRFEWGVSLIWIEMSTRTRSLMMHSKGVTGL
jgi:hypothetical protein